MTIEIAKKIAAHLIKTHQGFCFYHYELISREYLTEAFGITFCDGRHESCEDIVKCPDCSLALEGM
jgi:hypothetical protein